MTCASPESVITKSRPSGVNSMLIGEKISFATRISAKFGGGFAASAESAFNDSAANTMTRPTTMAKLRNAD